MATATKTKARTNGRSERMAELYREGMSLREIGSNEDPPISGERVRQLLVRVGQNRRAKCPVRDLGREVRMVRQYRSGLSLQEVANLQNPPVSPSAVHQALKRANEPRRDPGRPRVENRPEWPNLCRQLRDMYRTGVSHRDMASTMGISVRALQYWLRKAGLKPSLWTTREQARKIVHQYSLGFSMRQVAAMQTPPISEGRVRWALKQANEPRRKRSA